MSKIQKEVISSEHEIALIQLEKLKEISRARLLTPDEVKMYDLLVKNLRLIQEQSTEAITTTYSRIETKEQENDLVAYASGLTVIPRESAREPDETD